MEGETPWFSLGGTGGTNPPASDRDRLRLSRIPSAWLSLWLGVVDLFSGVGLSPEVKLSNTVKQMDSCESLLGVGGAESGVG